MRYGYWLPVFGGWLRNVDDEGMEATLGLRHAASRSAARRSATTSRSSPSCLLNDIKGIEAPSLDAWSTAAALAAVTERLELMVAVRPSFHPPAILAKQAANIDRISNGRLALNVVSAWWKDEARRYGVRFDEHDDRYARTDGMARRRRRRVARADVHATRASYYTVHDDIVLEPKPIARRRARASDDLRRRRVGGGEDAHRAAVRRVRHARRSAGAHRAEDRRHASAARAASEALGVELPPMQFGVAAYAIVRDTEREVKREIERITNVTEGSPGYDNYQDWIANTKLEQQVSLQDYSVSNRGLRAGLVGTPEQVAERVARIRGGGGGSAAAAVQPAARGDGALRRGGDAARFGGKVERAGGWAGKQVDTGRNALSSHHPAIMSLEKSGHVRAAGDHGSADDIVQRRLDHAAWSKSDD